MFRSRPAVCQQDQNAALPDGEYKAKVLDFGSGRGSQARNRSHGGDSSGPEALPIRQWSPGSRDGERHRRCDQVGRADHGRN